MTTKAAAVVASLWFTGATRQHPQDPIGIAHDATVLMIWTAESKFLTGHGINMTGSGSVPRIVRGTSNMALYESTGEVRQPKDGELYLRGDMNEVWERDVRSAFDWPSCFGPRVIMRKVEEKQ